MDEQTLGARLARQNTSLVRAERSAYVGRRRLEEAIRRHAEGECDCRSEKVCLVKLYRLIPLHPRPTRRKAEII